MAKQPVYPCIKCNKNVVNDSIECSICRKWIHRNCAKLSKKKLHELGLSNDYWFCYKCINVLPFFTLSQDEFLYINSRIDLDIDKYETYTKGKHFSTVFNAYNEYKACEYGENIDPDNNYYANFNIWCDYYTGQEFTSKFSKTEGLSIVHINCRSIRSNFGAFKAYLSSLEREMHESWLDVKDESTDFEIENYNMLRIDRKTKRGGGVMLYISKIFSFKLVENTSLALAD